MMTFAILILLCFYISTVESTDSVNSANVVIGTWNSYDVFYGSDRNARRDYFFANKEELFGDLDIFCTQESHTYSSIADFTDNFTDIFPYSYYHNEPSSQYQACLESEIIDFEDITSPIYGCNEGCTSSLPATLSYIFCLWRCFGELRNDITGITTRSNNADLFDFGAVLELSPCLACLWKSNFVNPMTDSWNEQNDTTDIMFEDILDVCLSTTNTFDYKVNEGIILWSKYAFDSVQFVPLPEAIFIPRGYIIATFTDYPQISVICTHLETPTINGYFGGKFTTMRQENIDNEVTQMSNITQIEVDELIEKINSINGSVIILGDLNIGINSRVDIYNKLLSDGGLKNVFGTNEELITAIGCSRCDTNAYSSNNEIVDNILIKGDISVNSAQRFLDSTYNTSVGLIPLSDHYGIMANLKILTDDDESNSNKNIPHFISYTLLLYFWFENCM